MEKSTVQIVVRMIASCAHADIPTSRAKSDTIPYTSTYLGFGVLMSKQPFRSALTITELSPAILVCPVFFIYSPRSVRLFTFDAWWRCYKGGPLLFSIYIEPLLSQNPDAGKMRTTHIKRTFPSARKMRYPKYPFRITLVRMQVAYYTKLNGPRRR